MQPHTVYSKHKELLQLCYWKLKVNPTYGADLAHRTIIFVPLTQHLRGYQFYRKKECRSLFSAMTIVKNLTKVTQVRQGAVELC